MGYHIDSTLMNMLPLFTLQIDSVDSVILPRTNKVDKVAPDIG